MIFFVLIAVFFFYKKKRGAHRKIINHFYGNSGIYYFINHSNPSLFYIGSSINLGRRLEEYWDIISGSKKPNNPFTKILTNKGGSDWSVIILQLCHPIELRLYEQLSIYLFKPTLNATRTISVLTQFATADLSIAILFAAEARAASPGGAARAQHRVRRPMLCIGRESINYFICSWSSYELPI
jgi:hypothetical protein